MTPWRLRSRRCPCRSRQAGRSRRRSRERNSHARPSWPRCAECMTTTAFSHAKLQQTNTGVHTHAEAAHGAQIDSPPPPPPRLASALIARPRTHPLGGETAAICGLVQDPELRENKHCAVEPVTNGRGSARLHTSHRLLSSEESSDASL